MPLSSVRNLSQKIIQNTFKTTKQFASGILSIFFYLFIYFFYMRMCIDSITITTSLKEETSKKREFMSLYGDMTRDFSRLHVFFLLYHFVQWILYEYRYRRR